MNVALETLRRHVSGKVATGEASAISGDPVGNKFKTKQGRLTRYALACGYVETWERGEFSARMEMISPSAGVIRVIVNHDPNRIAYLGKSIVAARRAYDNAKVTA